MINHTEFKLKNRAEDFRVAEISPVDLLAITTQLDFEKLEQTKTLVTFCLENVEVKMLDNWVPVKAKGKEVYFPIGIEEDLRALNEIFNYMLSNVISKTFMKSEE